MIELGSLPIDHRRHKKGMEFTPSRTVVNRSYIIA